MISNMRPHLLKSGMWFSLRSATLFGFSLNSFAAPQVQIQNGETTVATWGALAGELQVQADATTFDAKTNQMRLQGNVVLAQSEVEHRRSTLRAQNAVLASPDVEFQILDKTQQLDGRYSNNLLYFGNEAGYIESVFRRELLKHPGFIRYRMHYEGVGAGAKTSGTVLYHRRTQTLKIYQVFEYPEAKMFNVNDLIFSGVNDEMISKALDAKAENGQLRRNKNGGIEYPSLFSMQNYGAQRRDKSPHRRSAR